MIGRKVLIGFLALLMLLSCSSSKPSSPLSPPLKGEYLYRHHGESLFQVEPMAPLKRESYPWEERKGGVYPAITKDFFRCKGSSLNPVHFVQKEKELVRYYDCGGPQRHSLPLRENKEFIYPILIDLLNYLQDKTGKRIVITCGHCCPDHNLYLDPSPANQASKHLLGAEVDFYIQGMEQQPEAVVNLILAYYKENPKYKGLSDFEEFKRYDKGDSRTAIQPWYNKEIFIKLFKKTEGRDFDNRHPYPYISIQVRYDWDLQEKVIYTWDKAFRNFHRW
ncbi:hypothetical protein [Candidatus Protochlamydia phocaeensis]|uniref:hypothetical protein n=1 Tax=Candidatus Protochlamydia phocaeensis TaxID=1414722 RepID=UPI00083867D9|nr:hypothetical protein [Candidatus Protochlamydia phocaeensis]